MSDMAQGSLVAGIDFGTDSARVAVWDVDAGRELLTVSRRYQRWADGLYCVPERQQFRQHPLDYVEALEGCFQDIAEHLGEGSVCALAIDTTGSTPAPVNAFGQPLALSPELVDDPDCMFWLWKDHTSLEEAALVNAVLGSSKPDYTTYQGTYSSEWWWAKILRAVTRNSVIRERASSWMESSDWLANMLVGADDVALCVRNSCAAGHKALYNRRLGGMVPTGILARTDPYLARVAETMRLPPVPAGTSIGTLNAEWAQRLRLTTGTVVGMGSLDAHAGAVGAGIAERTLVKVVGTSTVDLFLTDYVRVDGKDTRSLCGLAEDSIVPGYLGGEASQAAFGDLFAWYARQLFWPMSHVLRPILEQETDPGTADSLLERTWSALLPALETEARGRPSSDLVALDWINGRRYPNLDDTASCAVLNLRIGHDAVDIYRALVEAASLGSKAIYQGIAEMGIEIDRVILVGGVANKSPFVCQMLADALNIEIRVCAEKEACAKGAATYAAVAAGLFESIPYAENALSRPFAASYHPSPARAASMMESYAKYRHAGLMMKDDRQVPKPLGGQPVV